MVALCAAEPALTAQIPSDPAWGRKLACAAHCAQEAPRGRCVAGIRGGAVLPASQDTWSVGCHGEVLVHSQMLVVCVGGCLQHSSTGVSVHRRFHSCGGTRQHRLLLLPLTHWGDVGFLCLVSSYVVLSGHRRPSALYSYLKSYLKCRAVGDWVIKQKLLWTHVLVLEQNFIHSASIAWWASV